VAAGLIEAYENRNVETFQSLLKRPQIKFLDNEVAKLAMSIKVPIGDAIGSVSHQEIFAQAQSEALEEGIC
jgi:hypothetical protein